ncbi:rab-GTPase-TBC domain-domain-containing protein [Absidia repens]|uniref:Rab-GTPase-TBC domain-domain-containing protein n=1 Tax=Absidia repens TaxID=90262 RepID=A0A1X2I5I6_9FUNG|nr:rab-GTPase-TBC domain-domain-containing protein [Absidia repens]
MTPSRSSTTQRFVSGLWSPFKSTASGSNNNNTTAASNAKKVVRPSANFTKRQSRPPSCALPGFQESLLAQMEQLNSDNGNDPKAQRLLNLKRQTIRQSLVLASSSGGNSTGTSSVGGGGTEPNNNDEYDWEFWTSVVCDFDQVQKSKTLPSQVQKGVPPPLRGMVWQLLSNSKTLDEQYIDLLRTSSPYDKMIQRDLARTFPDHTYFKDQGGVGQEGLYNVIRAYSVYDTEVGYCQGLAFIVGPLLLNMPDEEAFCVLIRLMSSYGLRGHFTPNMEGLHLRLYQFDCLVADHLPHISRHFKRLDIDATMYASQWFMTLFAYKFPLELVFRIYDMMFAQGLEAVLKFALALLKRNETHLLQLDFEHLLDFLKTGLFEEYKDDEHQLVHDANEWDIPRKRLVQLEKEHKAQVAKDEQDVQLLTSLQAQQASLQHTVDQLSQSKTDSQKEYQDVTEQLQDSQHQRQQLQDEQASLKTVVDSLRSETAALPSKVEANYKTEFDALCNENASLNERNAHLEDQLAATEALLIDIKMRYAQSEDERDDLSKRLFELKKVIAQ